MRGRALSALPTLVELTTVAELGRRFSSLVERHGADFTKQQLGELLREISLASYCVDKHVRQAKQMERWRRADAPVLDLEVYRRLGRSDSATLPLEQLEMFHTVGDKIGW